MQRGRYWLWPTLSLAMGLLQGCAMPTWNVPTAEVKASAPVTIAADPAKTDDVFIVLAFSGGGTRSAAFAYGVLETLRDMQVSIDGRPRRLLDEVDVITSVSGGSYTAAYYGLFGDRMFSDFEGAFLKRDVQGELVSQLANPLVLASLTGTDLNRSDIAATWLGKHIFHDKTIADMKRPGGPFVILNASDINTGTTFSFIQQQFDFLCSRVDDFPVGRAVMASSAVPGYFAPLALRNYDTDCPARHPPWVRRALANPDIYSRNYPVARALERYQHAADMPFVRLVDGGITDNLGVRGSMMSPVMHYGDVDAMRGAFDDTRLDRVSNVLVIVANAQIYEDYAWSRDGRAPGLIASLSASFDAGIGILNSETIGLARQGFQHWADGVNRRSSRVSKRPVKVRFATLTFDQIRDEQERRYFNRIPTALSLPGKQVDEVRGLARRLLLGSPEFRDFLGDLRREGVSGHGS